MAGIGFFRRTSAGTCYLLHSCRLEGEDGMMEHMRGRIWGFENGIQVWEELGLLYSMGLYIMIGWDGELGSVGCLLFALYNA